MPSRLLCLALLVLSPLPAAGLGYVESSQGLIPPTLEGGKTEVEFSDVNADGNVDLVSIGDHGSPHIGTDQHGIMVWFGDGQGAWSVFMNGDFGYGGVALGDINGDGLMDAAYGMHHDYSGSDFGNQLIEAALGDGTGRGWTPWDDGLATAGEDYGMFGTDLADFDNDGDLDLVCKSFGCCSGVHVYRNEGTGTWTHVFGFLGGNSGDGIYCGDINADGRQDFVVAHDAGTVYLGTSEGGFVLADGNLPPGGVTTGRQGLSIADIDRDGDLDLSFRSASASLEVWRWSPDGVWTDASDGLPTSGIALTQIADMNGDGWGDVIALGNGVLRVWLGDGGTSWTLAWTTTVPTAVSSQALRAGGDVDHNGYPDLAVVTDEGTYPNDHNHLHLFKEDSVPDSPGVRFTYPTGGELFVPGSTRFVDWIDACPSAQGSSVDIDLSTTGEGGPWSPIAQGIPSSGRFQWRIGNVGPTADARLRIRLHSIPGDAEAITPGPFAIRPLGPSSAAAEVAAASGLTARPNPMRNELVLSGLPRDGGPIRIMDAAGRVVRILPQGSSRWDGRDSRGALAPGGVYFITYGGRTVRVSRLAP